MYISHRSFLVAGRSDMIRIPVGNGKDDCRNVDRNGFLERRVVDHNNKDKRGMF